MDIRIICCSVLVLVLAVVVARPSCPAERNVQDDGGATSGQSMLKRKIHQNQQTTDINEDGSDSGMTAMMQVTAAAQQREDRVTLDFMKDGQPCTSPACEKAAAWLEPFINASINPCEDFAAFTCSLEKKRALRKQCEACEDMDFGCFLTSCAGDDMRNLAGKSSMLLGNIIQNATDPAQPPADFMGEGLSSLTQAVKIAHGACMSTPKFEDWWSKNETEQKQVIIDKMGKTAMDYIQRQLLPPDATIADLILHNGFFMEPLRSMGQLGTMGLYISPFFSLMTTLDTVRPSQSTKIVVIPAMCAEGFAVEGKNLSFTMDVAEEAERTLPGGRLFPEGTVQDAVSAFAELFKLNLRPCLPILVSLMQSDLDQMAPSVPLKDLQAHLVEEAFLSTSELLTLNVQNLLNNLGVPDGVQIHVADFGLKSEWVKQVASLFSASTVSRTKLALRFTRFHKYLENVWMSRQNGPPSSNGDPPLHDCWGQVQNMFPWFFARKFVTDVITEEARDRGEEIAWQIVETFADNLDALPWLDHETRLAAKKKLRHIRIKIGYPQWIMQDELLTRRYGYALAFNDNMTWAEMDDIAGRSQVHDMMSGVAKPRDWESFWLHTPNVFNMMYNPLANDIIGLAAFMQKPQYDGEMPMFYNFGFYGAVIGHELTHGFDSNGAERGPFGDKTDWWTSSSREKFEASKSCFEHQYSGYPIHGDVGAAMKGDGPAPLFQGEVGINGTELHDNGTKCLSENIADSGGLGLAAMSYQRWQKTHGVEQGITVGGKFFTAEQLFFMRYGAGWCDLVSNEGLQARINNVAEPHSVGRLRVVGAVQNSRAFAKAFQCPLGSDVSSMNPKEKCELWGIDVSLQTQDWSPKMENANNGNVDSFKNSAVSRQAATSIVIILAVLFK